jgi:hypothetical protein
MSNNSVLAKWEEMKKIVESLEHDVSKNANGNASAGVRARKGLRQLAACSKELVKLTIEFDKAEKSAKD